MSKPQPATHEEFAALAPGTLIATKGGKRYRLTELIPATGSCRPQWWAAPVVEGRRARITLTDITVGGWSVVEVAHAVQDAPVGAVDYVINGTSNTRHYTPAADDIPQGAADREVLCSRVLAGAYVMRSQNLDPYSLVERLTTCRACERKAERLGLVTRDKMPAPALTPAAPVAEAPAASGPHLYSGIVDYVVTSVNSTSGSKHYTPAANAPAHGCADRPVLCGRTIPAAYVVASDRLDHLPKTKRKRTCRGCVKKAIVLHLVTRQRAEKLDQAAIEAAEAARAAAPLAAPAPLAPGDLKAGDLVADANGRPYVVIRPDSDRMAELLPGDVLPGHIPSKSRGDWRYISELTRRNA